MHWYQKISHYWPRVVFVVAAAMIADIVLLNLRTYMIPKPVKLGQNRQEALKSATNFAQYQSIANRNIFSFDGTMPDTLASLKAKEQSGEGAGGADNVPVPTALPLTLIGTLVHSNPEKSIANIEIKSKNLSLAVRNGNRIDTIAKLEAVERGKIIIRNLNNNRLEYAELKEVSKLSFSAAKTAVGDADIKQVAPNKYELKRSDVDRYTADLQNVLQQAAMVPVRGPGGEVTGFRFVNIQNDSIYTKLGLQVGDVIKKINGEPIDSPQKALELYGALKGASTISVTSERDGREQTTDYNIK